MMKKIVTIATIFAAFVLSGCATSNIPMSDSEKAQIKSGELVKFTETHNTTNVQMPKGKKIFVCAVDTNSPSEETPCYPNMSAYMGKYFSEAGFDVVSSKEQADDVVYATLTYLYVGNNVKINSSGDAYRSIFNQAIEDSLEKNGQPEISEEALNTFYQKDVAIHQEIKNQARLETAGKILVAIAGMAMGGVNGGLNASQALTGMTNPANMTAPYGTAGPKFMGISLHEKNSAGKDLVTFSGFYNGPHDIYQSFDKLFPEALESTADLFAQNVTAK